ncbi:unnamed protein product [Polarella glacialis]|uniref:Uncharacterized protein n=1 Tax=Polarella glacialis TaxID=89957 RepID=A0A813FEX7_POLGL|nr:unnamed protein product [Polarella glacialis]CAE8684087.1 unnamed protein product [Polarella glacialis]
MKDAISEVRYQALRARLNDLHYYQPLSVDSSLVAETLLKDLLASCENFQALKQKDDLEAERLQSLLAELDALRIDNPRLQTENNSLHLELIEAGEAAEKREAASRLRLRGLDDQLESAKLALHSATNAATRWEQELNGLREEALKLLGHNFEVDALTLPELPAPPERRAIQWAPEARADAAAKESSLVEALALCRKQVAEMKARGLEAVARSASLEDRASACLEGQKHAALGPSPEALRRKVERVQLDERTAELKATVAQLTTVRAEQQQQGDALQAQSLLAQQAMKELRVEVTTLRKEEASAAELAGQLLGSSQDRIRSQKQRQHEAEGRRSELLGRCELVASSHRLLAAEIAQVARDEELELKAQAQQSQELEAELGVLVEENRKERTVLSDRTSRVRQRADEAEAECKAAETLRGSLEKEILTAQQNSEACLRQLSTQTKDIQSYINNGAQLQHHSQRSGAQVQLLSSSLLGLAGEQKMLLSHLQDKQQAFHKESVRHVELKIESQRLAAVVGSLDSTRKDWLADLDRAMGALQRSHASFATAKRLEEVTKAATDQLRRKAAEAQAGVEIASEQKDELLAEVQTWTAELQQEDRRHKELCVHSEAERERLHRLEAEAKEAARLQNGEAARLADRAASLQAELRGAWAEHREVEAARSKAELEARRRLLTSEQGLGGFHSELEALLQDRDTLLAEKAAAEIGHQRHEGHSRHISEQTAQLSANLRELHDKHCLTQRELAETQAAELHEAEAVQQLQGQLQQEEATASQLALGRLRCAQAVELQRVQNLRSLTSEKACEEELTASRDAVEAMASKCDELHRDVEELVAVASAAESARTELGAELAACQKHLLLEERARAQIAEEATGGGWGEEQKAAAAQVAALTQAARALDAERDDAQRLADIRAQEASDMSEAILVHERSLQKARRAMDDHRASAAATAEQLASQRQLLTDRRSVLSELCSSEASICEEAHESAREACLVLEDLTHMTMENQELHEELRLLELRVTARSSDARQQIAEQDRALQHLKAIELERDDIARLYQQVGLQVRQQQAALERLQADRDLARQVSGELGAELRRGVSCEQEWSTRSEQMQLDLSVLEGQLAEMSGRISSNEESKQEELEEDARLEGDLAAAAAACQGADQREAQHAHASASLRLRRQQLQAALHQTKTEALAQRRLAEDGWAQARRLEQLLEDARAQQRQSAAETDALRKARRGASTTHLPLPDVADLQQAVEAKYAEVGEMDAEQQRLQSELLRLREAMLRRTPLNSSGSSPSRAA